MNAAISFCTIRGHHARESRRVGPWVAEEDVAASTATRRVGRCPRTGSSRARLLSLASLRGAQEALPPLPLGPRAVFLALAVVLMCGCGQYMGSRLQQSGPPSIKDVTVKKGPVESISCTIERGPVAKAATLDVRVTATRHDKLSRVEITPRTRVCAYTRYNLVSDLLREPLAWALDIPLTRGADDVFVWPPIDLVDRVWGDDGYRAVSLTGDWDRKESQSYGRELVHWFAWVLPGYTFGKGVKVRREGAPALQHVTHRTAACQFAVEGAKIAMRVLDEPFSVIEATTDSNGMARLNVDRQLRRTYKGQQWSVEAEAGHDGLSKTVRATFDTADLGVTWDTPKSKPMASSDLSVEGHFREPVGDHGLGKGEIGSIDLNVVNLGRGPAFLVSVDSALSTQPSSIMIAAAGRTCLGRLPPGARHIFQFRVSALDTLPSEDVSVRFLVSEQFGGPATPVTVTFRMRGRGRPYPRPVGLRTSLPSLPSPSQTKIEHVALPRPPEPEATPRPARRFSIQVLAADEADSGNVRCPNASDDAFAVYHELTRDGAAFAGLYHRVGVLACGGADRNWGERPTRERVEGKLKALRSDPEAGDALLLLVMMPSAEIEDTTCLFLADGQANDRPSLLAAHDLIEDMMASGATEVAIVLDCWRAAKPLTAATLRRKFQHLIKRGSVVCVQPSNDRALAGSPTTTASFPQILARVLAEQETERIDLPAALAAAAAQAKQGGKAAVRIKPKPKEEYFLEVVAAPGTATITANEERLANGERLAVKGDQSFKIAVSMDGYEGVQQEVKIGQAGVTRVRVTLAKMMPDTAQRHLTAAIDLESKGQFQEALKLLEQAEATSTAERRRALAEHITFCKKALAERESTAQ